MHTHFIASFSFPCCVYFLDHVRKFRHTAIGLALTPPHLPPRLLSRMEGTLWEHTRPFSAYHIHSPCAARRTPLQDGIELSVSSLQLFSTFWHGLSIGLRSGSTVFFSKLIGTWPPAWSPQPQ